MDFFILTLISPLMFTYIKCKDKLDAKAFVYFLKHYILTYGTVRLLQAIYVNGYEPLAIDQWDSLVTYFLSSLGIGFLYFLLSIRVKNKIYSFELRPYKDREMSKKKKRVFLTTTILASIIFGITTWSLHRFGLLDFEVYIFTLTAPMNGTPIEMYLSAAIYIVVAVAIGFVAYKILSMQYAYQFVIKRKDKEIHLFPSKLFRFLKRFSYISGMLALCSAFIYAGYIFDVRYMFEPDNPFIEEHYVDPETTQVTFPENKRNLIYIFLESFETTAYSKENGGNQDVSLAPNLENILLNGKDVYNFSNTDKLGGGMQASSTGLSIAGMVAQTSGIPFKVGVNSNKYGEDYEFMPGLYSLGDMLQEQGYTLNAMLAMDKSFSGAGSYYENHGGFTVYGVNEFSEMYGPSDANTQWGIRDREVYAYSKDIISNTAATGQPFMSVIENIDTHTPGFVDETCPTPTGDPYKDSFSCSDRMLAEMITWIQAQPFYENTTIILQGDHLAWGDIFVDKNTPEYVRTTTNIIINPDPSVLSQPVNYTNRLYNSMDLFPTAVRAIGGRIEGDRLGLGTDLFSGTKTLFEEFGVDNVNSSLQQKSSWYIRKFLYKEED